MDDKALTSSVNVVNPEEYGRNRAHILAAKALLERMENENEAGRAKYESELLQKVHEGDEARQRLQQLQHYHNSRVMGPLTIEAAPSTARIEEISVSPPQPQSGQFTSGLMHNQKSLQSPLPAATQSTMAHLPPTYHNFVQHPPHREYQSYSGPPFRHYVPQTHNPAVPHSQSVRVQQPQPGFYHQMPTANHKQQVETSVQHQKPPVPRRTRPSSSQISVQPQAQTNAVRSSVPQAQVHDGNAYQDVQSPVHYNPTGVRPVGTSSLMGALGPQTVPSVQPGAMPPPASSTSSPAVPENVPKHPRANQATTSASNSQSTGIQSAPLSDSELEVRKLKILAFRSSILEWGRNSQPNTYTEFFNIKVFKAPNSALCITSPQNGREITEEQSSYFERLWVVAGLPLDAIPFKRGSTGGPPACAIATSRSVPSTTPRAMGTPIQSLSAQGGGHSVSSASHTRTPPKTPRQRTLVDPISGSWRSPADADKRRLARDVMHALGKRKPLFSHPSPNENPAKRQALEAPSTSGSVHRISEPVTRTSTTTATTLQVTSLQTERQLQPEVTSKPVVATGATNGISLEPSAQPIEPPSLTTVTPSTTSLSQSESSQVRKHSLGPSDPPESHSFPTPSAYSAQDGLVDGTPTQVARQSGSLPHEGPSTTPTQVAQQSGSLPHEGPSTTPTQVARQSGSLPHEGPSTTPTQVAQQSGSLPHEGPNTTPTQTLSPAHVRPTSLASPQQGPRESASSTPSTQSLIALPTIPYHGVSASSSISHEEADDQPRGSTEFAPANAEPSASSQMGPEKPSIGQLNRDGQDTPSSLPISKDYASGVVWTDEASSVNAREPLFLPSPSPSSSSLPSKKNKRSSAVYVLVPPPPEYLIRYRKRQRRKDELDSLKDNTPSSLVKTSRSLEALSLPLERERDTPIDPYEQEAIQFSCSRLQPMPCRWGECDIILNSVDTLIHHLNREHKPTGISFICRWTQCGRHCRSHEKHLERHAMMTLQCAYQGCKESYRASSQLLKHFRSKHLNGMLKVQAKPFHPHPQAPVPLPNIILPSYLIVAPPVTPTSISPEEHSVLEPWVLRNIAGFDIARPKRARKASGYGSTEEETSNTYEFLNMRSTRYSWNQSEPVAMDFDDLDSEEISKECDRGLTFFGTDTDGTGVEDTPPSDEEAPSPLFSSPPNMSGDANVETAKLDWQTTTTEPSDEEVQKLLID